MSHKSCRLTHELPTVKDPQQYIVGIGEILWDMLPQGKQLGGAPANFAYHVSQCGLKSRVVSAVGNDPLGKDIHNVLSHYHLEGIVTDVPYPTGIVEVSVNAQGIPSYEIKKNVAWDNLPFTNELEKLSQQTQAVCWGTLAQRSEVSRNTIKHFLESMPTSGDRLKIFDINLRQNFYTLEIIEDSLNRCNILKINDEELLIVKDLFGIGHNGIKEISRFLLKKYHLRMLVLTCGAKGSYLFTPEEISFVETPKVQVVDTVGAGDSFTGVLVAGLVLGLPIRKAHERAVKVSAFVCTQQGAMPKLPISLLSETF